MGMTRMQARDDDCSTGEEFNLPPSRDGATLLTVQEVSEMLKVPVSWVYEHTRERGAKRLPHLKLGKYIRFEEHAVREFLGRQRRT
jgi:excisionase family DNA binding protein